MYTFQRVFFKRQLAILVKISVEMCQFTGIGMTRLNVWLMLLNFCQSGRCNQHICEQKLIEYFEIRCSFFYLPIIYDLYSESIIKEVCKYCTTNREPCTIKTNLGCIVRRGNDWSKPLLRVWCIHLFV